MTDEKFLPYGKHHINSDDIDAVVNVLQSDWLTQGPMVPEFEDTLADTRGASYAVACASGTAALHLSMLATGLKPGEAVITSANTFVASANCARFVGAQVIFADIDPATGLIDPDSVEHILRKDTDRNIKAIIPVHFAGQPADLPALHDLADKHGALIVDDACHALGATYSHGDQEYRIGGNPHSDLTVFSFHPVKHVAMGEGGAVVTDNDELAERVRLYRNHGISRSDFVNADLAHDAEGVVNPWYYEMHDLGYNYRLTDIQAALGLSQLRRLQQSLTRRREIAELYRRLIPDVFKKGEVTPLQTVPQTTHAYHLFVVKIDFDQFGLSRAVVMNRLRAEGIGTQVHYIPVHLQPYYRRVSPANQWNLPGVEEYYARALTLPMYPELTDLDVERVVEQLASALGLKQEKLSRAHKVGRG
jgi:UDP-4-amino-4,6-dideoxy-N-acetyl-beta-L-altrosamine transaminase